MTADEIRDRIATEMRNRRLTATALADMTGIERANISRYFGSNPITVSENVFKMLDALGLELVVQPKATTGTVSWDRKEP